MPLVLVDIASVQAPPEHARALATVCSQAVGEGRCQLADGSTPGQPAARALVTWDGPELRGAVVLVRLGGGAAPLSSELAFVEADEKIERWRAVGLAIATLANRAEAQARTNGNAKAADAPEPADTAGRSSSRVANSTGASRAANAKPLSSRAARGARAGEVHAASSSSSFSSSARGSLALPRAWLGASGAWGRAFVDASGVRAGAELGLGYRLYSV